MFLKKDELSKFDFISLRDFAFAILLMIAATFFSYFYLPVSLNKFLAGYSAFYKSHYFGIILFFLSGLLNFYIIYYFSCRRKNKTLIDGLFLKMPRPKTILISFLIGIIMPLLTLPIIFKFAPHEFYAMNLTKTTSGLVYLFTCAMFAPVFEELFYRGFIFPFFQSKLNSFWAIIITSLFFGFSHFMNIGHAYILLSLFIFYGFVLTLIRYFTNSLIPSVITHYFHNATLIYCFLVVGRS